MRALFLPCVAVVTTLSAMTLVTGLAPVLAAGQSGGEEETIIRPGDTIAISAFGSPDLEKKTLVEKSGLISYPLLGEIRAAGISPSELRRKIIDGLVQSGVTKDPKIGVEIAAREPFYVTGDVMKPGAQPFTLNVTVRSAIALAGGLDPTGLRGLRGPNAEPVQNQGQYELVALDYVRQRAHVRAVEAALASQKFVQFDDLSNLPIRREVADRLNQLEADEFRMRADAAAGEKRYLQAIITDTQAQIDAMTQRKEAEEDAVRQETTHTSQYKSLSDKGVIVQERYFNERRAMLVAQGKLFDLSSTLASTRRQLEELKHKLQGIDEARRMALVKELQDAYIAATAAESKLNAVGAPVGPRGAAQPRLVVYRQSGAARIRLGVDEDAAIQPGDILEVKFETGPLVAGE